MAFSEGNPGDPGDTDNLGALRRSLRKEAGPPCFGRRKKGLLGNSPPIIPAIVKFVVGRPDMSIALLRGPSSVCCGENRCTR